MNINPKFEILNSTCKFSRIYSASKQILNSKFKTKNSFSSFLQGFTLIELLVVMGIIMLLMAIAITSYQNAQKAGRDAKRKADLRQVQAAVEMYRSDNDTYPKSVNGNINGNLSTVIGSYLTTIPSDPTSGLFYYYESDGITHKFCAYLENATDQNTNCTGISCGTVGAVAKDCNYGILNP